MFAAVLLTGCASTKVSNREILVTEKLPRPDTIWVYNFVSSANEVPAYSPVVNQMAEPATPQTPEQIEAGHRVGAIAAEQLVEDINAMGMHAVQVTADAPIRGNDIVVRGYILSLNEGSATKRVTLGFGSGASELGAAVEGFQMTPRGLRKLGSATLDSGGGKSPGAALGLAGLIATANPIGLIVSGGTKIYGEATGSAKIEGRAKAVAKEVAEQIKLRLQQQGWIP